MTKTLLDTDILSEILKGIDRTVGARSLTYLKIYGQYTTSAVTIVEVVKGHSQVLREDRVEQFLQFLPAVEVLPLDSAAAVIAGRIQADLKRTGQPIGWADPLIAAIALHHNLTLATGNLSDYRRIQGLGYALQIDNWRERKLPAQQRFVGNLGAKRLFSADPDGDRCLVLMREVTHEKD